MISPLYSGFSAITAFSAKMSVTANNIANLNSDGFGKSRTILREGPFGGVEPVVEQNSLPGPVKPDSKISMRGQVESSNVDPVEEVTESISTQAGYKANIKTVQAYDEMLGSLLDTIG